MDIEIKTRENFPVFLFLCAQGGNLFDKSFLAVARKARLLLLVILAATKTYSGLSRPDADEAVHVLPVHN